MSGNVAAGTSSVADQVGRKWIAAVVGIAILALIVAQFSTAPNKGFADGAAVLAMISLVAVGIERSIEMIWSLVTTFKGAWWPLGEIAAAVDSLVRDTNAAVGPAFDSALEALEAAKKGLAAGSAELKKLDDEMSAVRAQRDEYDKQVQRISSLAKDNQRVQLLATTAFQAVNRLDTAYGATVPGVRKAFNDASQVATGVSDILAGFKDNPAKQMLSIVIGTFIGLAAAGFVGLDLFAAAGAPLTVGGWHVGNATLFPFFGVALTGLVLGLGANPTHEVIKYVTEAAKSRRADNVARPDVGAAPDGGPTAGGGPIGALLERVAPQTHTATPRMRPGSMNLNRRS